MHKGCLEIFFGDSKNSEKIGRKIICWTPWKWGKEAEESVGKVMKQINWQYSYKSMHWKSLTAKQHK
jgi:hypothetical protein